jgi:hypothetical protein
LRDYLFGKDTMAPRHQDAFPGAAAFINVSASITDDLAAVIRSLPQPDRDAFQQACPRALSKLELDADSDITVAENLITLSVHINSFEMLDALRQIWVSGRHPSARQRLSVTVLIALRDIALPGHPEIAECVRAVIDPWHSFPSKYSRLALLAMTRSAPRDLLSHLRYLFEPMEGYYGWGVDAPNLEERRRAVILDVADLVADRKVLAGTATCGLRRAGGQQPGAEEDLSQWTYDWWYHTLTRDKHPDLVKLRQRIGFGEPVSDDEAWRALQEDEKYATQNADFYDDEVIVDRDSYSVSKSEMGPPQPSEMLLAEPRDETEKLGQRILECLAA